MPAGQQQTATLIPTAVGPLPADLWGLLGQEPPLQMKTAVPPIMRTITDPEVSHPEISAVETAVPSAPSQQQPLIQRVEDVIPPAANSEEASETTDTSTHK